MKQRGAVYWAGFLCWACYGGLLLQQIADAWITRAPWLIWLGKLLPLLVFLPGMLRRNMRSYIWVCFVSLWYFILLVQRVFADTQDMVSQFGLAMVVALFVWAMLYVRWYSREQQAAQSE